MKNNMVRLAILVFLVLNVLCFVVKHSNTESVHAAQKLTLRQWAEQAPSDMSDIEDRRNDPPTADTNSDGSCMAADSGVNQSCINLN